MECSQNKHFIHLYNLITGINLGFKNSEWCKQLTGLNQTTLLCSKNNKHKTMHNIYIVNFGSNKIITGIKVVPIKNNPQCNIYTFNNLKEASNILKINVKELALNYRYPKNYLITLIYSNECATLSPCDINLKNFNEAKEQYNKYYNKIHEEFINKYCNKHTVNEITDA